ncbi:hypothetical protein PC129_g23175 [Phytophthora cactorum]|uniref:Reverse transcriptase domain-containing protein n=1 Tax=Phytophthora cactorum TaxID=29920 RepID=A0A8T1GVI1_9STRA|nr:hypothetical protein PC111_g18782 [Phytophthora cactorum]KAG2804495.1 hypothetical protein PC112_g18698 [Phytophthora cactorum]KAG2838277.1 hypothetical protein PC113_g19693 [Phytophthora cactorum]KAG2881234.1 hypothetical protein PC114_g21673 [Phytophthora cactorum]KAG2891072.1 hypothetical protein PC115_g19328 [Phytophthora cactorum]
MARNAIRTKNAPATFNRSVTHLLRSVRDFPPSYFDDVFVHSRAVNGKTDVEVHMEHLRKLVGLMRKHKLYANLKKCIFGASEIPILGCLVGKNGVRPDPEKLCKYVENYAVKIRSLSQLLKKEAAWKWTAEYQQAFDAVKQSLTEHRSWQWLTKIVRSTSCVTHPTVQSDAR